MLKGVLALIYIGCNYLIAPVEPQVLGIVQSSIEGQCLRQVYLGNGPWIELADCSAADQNQWVYIFPTYYEYTQNDFTEFQFYNTPSDTSFPPQDAMQPIPPPMAFPPFSSNSMCLSLYGDDIYNPGPVLAWNCYGQINQRWQVNGDYDIGFQLQLQYTDNCLTLGNNTKYATQEICDPNYAANQTWVIMEFDHRARQVQSQGNNLCLQYVGTPNHPYEVTLVACNPTDGSQLAYPHYDNNPGQTFSAIQFKNSDVLIYPGSADGSLAQENSFVLQFFGNCLTINDADNSTSLQTCTGVASQAWNLVDLNPSTFNNIMTTQLQASGSAMCLQPASDGNFNLVDCTTALELMAPIDWESGTTLTPGYLQFSGNCLTMTSTDTSTVTQLPCEGAMYQRWNILTSDSSTIQLQNSFNNLCLTAEESLAFMYLSNCTDTDNMAHQMWTVVDTTK